MALLCAALAWQEKQLTEQIEQQEKLEVPTVINLVEEEISTEPEQEPPNKVDSMFLSFFFLEISSFTLDSTV